MSHLFRVAAREWRRSLSGGGTQSAGSRARVFASSADGSGGGASATVEAARRTAIPPDGPGPARLHRIRRRVRYLKQHPIRLACARDR